MSSNVTIFRGSPHTDLGNLVYNVVDNKVISSNVATISSSAEITSVGNLVYITGVDSTIDGTHIVDTIPSQFPSNVPTPRSFTYSTTSGNVASAIVSPLGAIIANTSYSGGTVTNISAVNYGTTITTGANHGLVVGDIVALETKANITLGAIVLTVPSPTTFTYFGSTQTIANASTTGAWTRVPPVYVAPAGATAKVNNIVINNRSASVSTYSIFAGSEPIAENTQLGATTTAYIDLEQIISSGEKLTVCASNANVMFHISGEIV
jgi:hypothetical protein